MAQTAGPVDDVQPPAAELSTIWVAYALHAAGAAGFFPGPVIGVIVNYVRCDDADTGLIASHHRWLIRSFWWILAACLLCTGVIVAGLWPLVGELARELIRSGGTSPQTISLDIRWQSVFATVGATTAGGLGFVVAWIWYVYRIVRGGLLLAQGRPAP